MPSSAPAGASTNQPRAGASVYTPTAQGPADQFYQQILNPNGNNLGAAAANPSSTPAGQAYQLSSPFVNNFVLNNPGMSNYLNDTGYSLGLGANAGVYALNEGLPALENYAQTTAGMAPGVQSYLQNTGYELGGQIPAILQASMDPQSALYNRTLDQVRQQTAASSAASGVGGTPYGQDIQDKALSDFNINWQNNQLQRMIQGASTASGLGTTSGNLVAGGALDAANLLSQAGNFWNAQQGLASNAINNVGAGTGAEYNAFKNIATDALNAESSLANMGTGQYQLPQQALNDLQSYLGLGQAASQISGQLGQMGQNQLGQSLAGIGGALGAGNNLLFGSQGIGGANGLLGAGGLLGGANGLFGGSGAGAASALTDFGGGGAALGVPDALGLNVAAGSGLDAAAPLALSGA